MKLRMLFILPLSVLIISILSADSLVIPLQRITSPIHQHRQRRNAMVVHSTRIEASHADESSRRNLLKGLIGVVSSLSIVVDPYYTANVANAVPMISTNEFNTIIRDSSRSIEIVEFSGPKSETVQVKLVDGTTFGINDVVESSTDPRSPLKVAAMCKANQIPYKFINIEAVLNAAPRKKKVYTNERVLQAAEKEKEKAIRMEQDEMLRQEQLRDMQ